MLKYFSEILSKFTVGQRLIVLGILVAAFVLVTLGPKVLDTFTIDNTESTQTISSLRAQVRQLQNDMDTLNNRLRKNQIECTDMIIQREKEILADIGRVERMVRSQQRNFVVDTVVVNGIPLQSSPIRTSDPMMEGLNMIKQNIHKDMEKRGGNNER